MTKVLLVEDDNNLREIYEARLAAEGYEINAAQDGEEALEVAKKVQPDLIISDVMMPRISGFEMLDILRNTQGLQHTKVIMLTALGQEEDKTRADSLGADRYLVKSQVTLEDIVKAADELLNGAPQAEVAGSEAVPASAPQPSEQLSPTAPPAVAAAAHSTPSSQVEQPAATLNTFENNQPQPEPATVPAPAEQVVPAAPAPIVGGPAPVTNATVAADPVAANDQALQAAAAQLSADAPAATAQPEPTPMTVASAAPASTPTPSPDPVVAAPAPATTTPSLQPATPEPSQPEQPATPPEAQTPPLPSLPEIERAMEQNIQAAPAPQQSVAPVETPSAMPAEQPSTVTPETAPPMPDQPPTPTEQPAVELSRPTISTAPPEPTAPAPTAAPEVSLPDTQSTAQEASTVSDQIADFGAQFPANVGEVVEAPGSVNTTLTPEPTAVSTVPTTDQPTAPLAGPGVPTDVTPVAVTEVPTDPVAMPTQTPATGGQRTIQPLTDTKPAIDIHELAAREGHDITPPGNPGLSGQPGPGGIFTPNQNGSANDAAL